MFTQHFNMFTNVSIFFSLNLFSVSDCSLNERLGFRRDEEGKWYCFGCSWASLTDTFQVFLQQHGLFSPNCVQLEKEANFRTKGFIVATQYRPLRKRVIFQDTSLGEVLCYLKQPRREKGVEFVELFLFWEKPLASRSNEHFLQQVYTVVEKLEQIYEIKFVLPLRKNSKSDLFSSSFF